MAIALLFLLFLIVMVLGLARFHSRPKNFPPGISILWLDFTHFSIASYCQRFILYCSLGPRGLPLLGYAPFLLFGGATYKLLQKLAKTYGPVAGFFMGPSQAFVSVVGAKAVREALFNDDLIGRPSTNVIRNLTYGEALGNMMFFNYLFHAPYCLFWPINKASCSPTGTFGRSSVVLRYVICAISDSAGQTSTAN